MDNKTVAELATRYLKLANELDREGLSEEAAEIDSQILWALENDLLPVKMAKKSNANNQNVKVAIRGQSDWNDYLESMVTGAGAGAGATLATGVGAPGVGIGAAVGAGVGALGTWGGDIYFNNFSGRYTKATTLADDFAKTVQQLSKLISEVDPNSAEQLLAVAEIPSELVKEQKETRYQQLSEKYGLDPKGGFLYKLKNLPRAYDRWHEMRASTANKMQKLSESKSIGMSDFSGMAAAEQAAAGTPMNAKSVGDVLVGNVKNIGVGGAIKGVVGGFAGGLVANWGYNSIANWIRGRSGQIRKGLSDLQKIATVISQLTGDTTSTMLAQQISVIVQQSMAQLQQKMQQPTGPNGAATTLYNQQATYR